VEQRLVPLNALIGLVTPGDVNAAVLAEAGFRLVGLEVPVVGQAGRVTVDALLFHEVAAHLVLCELKSGANAEEGQARRYAAIDPGAVVQAAHVTLPRRLQPSVEILYVCPSGHVERIRQSLTAANVTVPVLGVHEDKITLELSDAASEPLHRPFQGGPVRLIGPVLRLVPFDHDSPVEVILPHVRAELVALLAQRVPQVTMAALAERAAPYLGLYGRAARNRLVRRVGEVVRQLASAEPSTFAYEAPTANREGLVRFLRTPEDYDPRGRTAAYQALARRRDTRRRRATAVDPNQLDLLAELDLAETVSGDGDTGEEEYEDEDSP
jgi:hypothetical protein